MIINDLKPPSLPHENNNEYIPNTTSTIYCLYDREYRIADYDTSGNLLHSYTYGMGIDELVALTSDAPHIKEVRA